MVIAMPAFVYGSLVYLPKFFTVLTATFLAERTDLLLLVQCKHLFAVLLAV
jgi:hypothetical protein